MPATKEWVLDARGLSKTFGKGKSKFVAVKDVSLKIPAGQIVGLLGPNGAGKSTTLYMILGVLGADNGTGTISGHPLGSKHARLSLGFLPEHVSLPGFYTAEGLLRALHRMAGLPSSERRRAVADSLKSCGLQSHADRRISALSAGLRQRVGWAQALLGEPRLILLDEPTSNLDPQGRLEAKVWMEKARKRGSSILLSTHILSDVERLADRVLIMDKGRLIKDLDRRGSGKKKALERIYLGAVARSKS